MKLAKVSKRSRKESYNLKLEIPKERYFKEIIYQVHKITLSKNIKVKIP